MTGVEIKTKLYQEIEHSAERLLNMIYAMARTYSKYVNIYETRKNIILAEREKHLAGINPSYSWEEMKHMAINNQRTYLPN